MSLKIKLYNTLTASKEEIITNDPDVVKMYVCGPTVYNRPHLGNARSIVVYDLLFRLLKQSFKEVIYVRNITDVDDKINKEAKQQGISISQLTTQITKLFHADIKALNTLPPTIEPKATDNILEMIEIIKKLIEKKHAYVVNGNVLFDVSSYQKYGQLSHRDPLKLMAGARIEIADYKKNPLDFVLWKPSNEDDDVSSIFDSPWGKGRPGWHIECSAMSSKYLGVNFDIHGGGADLQFPHHENEIAQSCCAHENSSYARYWVHNGFLTVNGEKMSKSLKNFVTVFDLLQQNINGVAIRLMLLSSHYRKPLDFNAKSLSDAQKTIEKFNKIIAETKLIFKDQYNLIDFVKDKHISQEVLESLSDDLNFSKTLACLHNLVKKIKDQPNEIIHRQQLIASLNFLGLIS